MASYNELIALIDAYINQNGVQAITGQVLNGVLRAMVDQLGRGYTIMGTAVPSTDPGTPDGPESWFASTPGTYTDMGGLTVANAELALLSYTPSDGWAKTTLTQGIVSTSASVNNQVGTPSVTSSYVDGVLTFTFENLKGNTGDPAGFGAVTASVDSNIGTPSVQVQTSGPDTAKAMSFQFHNLKGETGVTSVVATVDNTTGNPTCAVSLVGQELHLDFTGLKGVQGDTGVSADYPITIANNLTTNDPTSALSAAMGVQLESEISQLDLKVEGNLMSLRAKNALMALFQKVAYAVADVSSEYNELNNAIFNLDEIVGLSAVYTQGDTIIYDQGINTLAELKPNLVVKAVYGDGTEASVTTYTLSGNLTAGTSTITVEYQGFTTTFTVTVTHYTAQMVYKMSDSDIGKYKGGLTRKENNTIFAIWNFGTADSRRVFLMSSGVSALPYSTSTQSTGKYPIPIPRNARKISVSISPSATQNVSIGIGHLEDGFYMYTTGSFLSSYENGGIVRQISDADFDLYRKGGWYLIVGGSPVSSYSGNEPTEVIVTFE